MGRRLAFFSSLVLTALFLAGCSSANNPSPAGTTTSTSAPSVAPGVTPGPGVSATEIRLGMTNDLAARGDTPYAAVTTAMQAYFKKVNAEDGGACARQITLLAEDDQYSPQMALDTTKKLVEQDNVLAIVGALGTTVHAPVAAYLNDPNADGNTSDGIPDLYLSTGWSAWGDVKRFPWSIGYIPDYVSDATVLARYINDSRKGEKVGIIYEDSDFGRDYLAGLEGTLADPSLLAARQPYQPAAPDLKPQIAAVHDAGATVVVLAATPDFSAKAFAAARDAGFRPQFLLSYVNLPSRLAGDVGGGTNPEQLVAGFAALDGSVVTSYLLSPVAGDTEPAIVEHRRIMKTYNGPAVSSLSVYGQSLAELIIETFKRACANLTRKGLIDAAESIRAFHSSLLLPGIDVNLGPQDHYAIQAMQLFQIDADGTLKQLGEPISVE